MEYWDLTSYKRNNSWSDNKDDEQLWLLMPDEYASLEDGTPVESINGEVALKGDHTIDDDVRAGYMAWGLIEYLT